MTGCRLGDEPLNETMGRVDTSKPQPRDEQVLEPARLARADRRDALLDAAGELVAAGDAEAVSMEAVAERAGVSRTLGYKHFGNRHQLLAALYQRESTRVYSELVAEVAAEQTLEGTFRALIHGALRAQANRGATFAALRAAGSRTDARREEERDRDRTTLRYFAAHAMRDIDLDQNRARAAVGILLGAIDAVLAQWRAHPTPEHSALLEDTYVALVMGGLDQLVRQQQSTRRQTEAALSLGPDR
jgi:AcrR family transcriptional regulator